MPTKNADPQKINFLIEAYRLRFQLHSEHTSRLWTRFNFLLTAEIAFLGVLYTAIANASSLDSHKIISGFGIIVSLLWYILGAQDHYYFEGFRQQVRALEQTIAKELGVSSLTNFPFGQVQDIKRNLVTWHWSPLSLSKLIAIFPIFFLFLWIGIFLFLSKLIT